jgi:ATP/maltotriose-dependent transcriptional regulator MalT
VPRKQRTADRIIDWHRSAGHWFSENELIEEAIRDIPSVHTRAFANYFLGAVHYWQNKLEAAESELLKIWEDRHTANPTYVAYAVFIVACIHHSRGDEAAAAQMFSRLFAYCQEHNYASVLSISRAFEAEFAQRRGDIQQTRQLSRQADFRCRSWQPIRRTVKKQSSLETGSWGGRWSVMRIVIASQQCL